MRLLIGFIAVMLIPFCACKEPECSQRNTSCEAIKVVDGYQYFYFFAPDGSEIELYFNETLSGHGGGKQPFIYGPGVIRMDKMSVITRRCLNLTLKYIVPLGDDMITERCLEYKVTEEMKETKKGISTPPLGIIIAVAVVVAVAVLSIIGILHCRVCVSWTFQPVIDPGTDGETPEALSPDHNLSNGGTQLSNDQCIGVQVDLNSGTKSVPDINMAWNHRAMNRNLRDDPGGLNGDKGEDTNIKKRDMPNDWTPGDQSLEEHDSEGQPLLSELTAIQDFNMTGEPIALVNRRGLDPDQAIGCSIAPDKGSSDVESTS